MIHQGTDAQLTTLFAALQQANIKLALEYGVLTNTPACGTSVEGYNGPSLGAVAMKMKRLGGQLDAITMDEPLWYGAFYSGKNACKGDLQTLATQAASNIALARQVFPNLRVGDIEPVDQRHTPPDWPSRIGAWADAYRAATGRPLDFLHVDVVWDDPRHQAAIDAVWSELDARGIPVGIIYNASSSIHDSAAWFNDALTHIQAVDAHHHAPAQAIFQTWVNYPDHVLPETRPGSLTNLVLRYLSPK